MCKFAALCELDKLLTVELSWTDIRCECLEVGVYLCNKTYVCTVSLKKM